MSIDLELMQRLAIAAGYGVESHPMSPPKVIGFGKLSEKRSWLYGIPVADFERIVATVALHCAEVAEQGVAEIDSEDMLVAGAQGAANDIRRAFGLPLDEPEPRPEWIAAQKART